MKRTILVAVAVAAPLAAYVGPAVAQLSITTSTGTPVSTATAQAGGPANIDVTSTGSINLTVSGAAVTINSNNTLTNEGQITSSDVNNVTGVQIQGGNTGSVTNTGTINISESYAPSDSNLDGLIDGDFASGGNRIGIAVSGVSPFTGSISNFGTITVHGNASYGVLIAAPITGDFQMINVTPASGSTAATIANGSISIVGNNSVGLFVAATNQNGRPVTVGGNVRLAGISATGVGAQGAVLNGSISGSLEFAGAVTSTGYRTTTRASNPALSALYTAQELAQGGAAVTVGGSVGGGIIVSAPPLLLSTTNLDLDNNGVPDTLQGTGQITSFGSKPALQIGVSGQNAVVGQGASGYGLLVQGALVGNGVFDTITSPNLPGAVSATALQIGAPTANVTIAGGVHNTGSIQAQSYQADATAIHILAGATVPTVVNDGVITTSAVQINTTTTAAVPLNVNAVLIDSGASVGSFTNNSGITANITGSGGLGGAVGGIIDRSGSITSISNYGTISAQLTQSLITSPLPGTLTAIDVSKSTAPQTFNQSNAAGNANATSYSPTTAYAAGAVVSENGVVYQALGASAAGIDPGSTPTTWRQIGATTPVINGSILFGSGGTTFNVNAGVIVGPTIDLGSGVNTINLTGASTFVNGNIKDGGLSTLTVNVNSGTLSATGTTQIQAKTVNVGSTGVLLIAGDPNNSSTARFVVTGSGAAGSVFAQGAQVGLTLNSLQIKPVQTYVVVQTAGSGTLTAGTFAAGSLSVSPFLYSSSANFIAASTGQPAEITVTAGLKTQAQLGFTNAESNALPAILAAAPANAILQSALLAQTTQSGLRLVYDQLLPNQGQGLFDALDRAAQSVSSLTSTTPDAGTRVAGSSLWLQEVNERVRRTGVETQGSYAKLLGIIGGYEKMGPMGGAAGVTLAYYNAEEAESGQQVGGNVVASMVEGGAYYRRAVGGFTVAGRAGGGYSWFSGERRLVTTGLAEKANSNWNGYFLDGHFGMAYEQRLGRFYIRPELSADYLRLHENSHAESGGDASFDLNTADRTSSRFSGQAIVVVGSQFGKVQWLRTEVRGGYREVFSGDVGNTVANFVGGSPFSLSPDSDKGGWATLGVALKGGSQFSYVALEGDADFRSGEQRYDIRIAGRSIF